MEQKKALNQSTADNLATELMPEELRSILSRIAESENSLVVVTDANRRTLWANAAFLKKTGFQIEEVLGKNPGELLQGAQPDLALKQRMSAALDAGEAFQCEILNFSKENIPYWIDMDIQPVHNRNGILTHFVAIQYDISERKELEFALRKKEEALQRSKNLLNDIEKITKTGGWEYTVETGEMFWTDELYRIHEMEVDPTIDHINGSIACYHPEDHETIRNAFEQCLKDGIGYDLEFPFRTVKGNQRWIRTKTEPVIENGTVVKVIGSFTDITELKHNTKLLRDSEYKLKAILNSTQDGNLLIDKNYKILSINEAAKKNVEWIFGTKIQENDSILDVLLPETEEAFKHDSQKALAGNTVQREFPVKGYWFKFIYFPVYDDEGELLGYSLNTTNVHALKIAEEKQNKLIQQFNHIGETVPGVFYLFQITPDGNYKMEYISKSVKKITGLDPHTIEEDISQLFALIHPDDTPRVLSTIEKANQNFERWHDIFRIVLSNSSVIYIEGNSLPSRESDGTITWTGYFDDVTERIKSEQMLSLAKEKAEVASRAKSDFLAVMSHELRTPLSGVIGFTELLQNTDLTPLQRRYLDHANRSGHNLLRIINDILDFSKIEAGVLELFPEETDLTALIRDSLEIVRATAMEKKLTLSLHTGSGLPGSVYVDPVRLTQILTNLLGNAVKFTEFGEVALRAECRSVEEGRCTIFFEVRDTGIGISDEQKKRLFKAFSQADSSTTRQYGGTGLGLVISQMIAQKMGSRIDFESRPGKGSRFYFELSTEMEASLQPAVQEKSSSAVESPLKPDAESASVPSILIAEDVSLNMHLISALLGTIIPEAELFKATNGVEAVTLWQEKKPGLILMDLQMPEMGGLDATRKIRELEQKSGAEKPTTIIALTAAAMKEDRDECFEAGMDGVLTKPIDTGKLKEIVNARL